MGKNWTTLDSVIREEKIAALGQHVETHFAQGEVELKIREPADGRAPERSKTNCRERSYLCQVSEARKKGGQGWRAAKTR
jgi:hypothetical protein